MFKFVLLRAVQTTAQVFSDIEVPTAKQCKRTLEKYNREAKVVWEKEGVDFLDRRRECKAINARYFRELDKFPTPSEIKPVPPEAAAMLDLAFKTNYTSPDLFLLFGRTDDKAREVQDAYAASVATALRKLDERYEARAKLYLLGRYGRGAPLPLLSMSSAEAMWEMCTSYYYNTQIGMVSLAAGRIKEYADAYISFTSGLSHSRRSCSGWSSVLPTACTGSFDHYQGRTKLSSEQWVWFIGQD